MPLITTQKRLERLEANIRDLLCTSSRNKSQDRQLSDSYRAVLRTYHDIFDGNKPEESLLGGIYQETLMSLARDAILYFGGESDPRAVSLKDYDHNKYGPFLGVSDEGSAAHVVRRAALQSPKMQVIGSTEPIIVGVAHDAERLGAAGEVPVGPEEYANIRLECAGRILTSTNVGTRSNLRYYRRYPVVIIRKGSTEEAICVAETELKDVFAPFINTPNGNPRPLTVYIEFDRESRRTFEARISILKRLSTLISRGEIANPKFHQLGLNMRIGFGYKGRNAALLAIDLTSAAGLSEVAIDGIVRKEADEHVSFPGILNYLEPSLADPVLHRAQEKGIQVRPKNTVDPDTVARSIWSALNSARHMGLELGKYGTFPLTLEESDQVIGDIQRWFTSWTAAPVFFVDQGILSRERVYVKDDVDAGIREWFKIIEHHRVPVVLIDTLDKSKGWRLLRNQRNSKGLLRLSQIKEIDQQASSMGIRVLWAGGITIPDAYDLGKISVFGVFVTSAVASEEPISSDYESDPMLTSLMEPTVEGVAHAKLLLEAGFLVSRLEDRHLSEELEKLAYSFIEIQSHEHPEEEIKRSEMILFERMVTAWKVYLKDIQ